MKKLYLMLGIMLCFSLTGCSEKVPEIKTHELSGLEYKASKEGLYDIINPMYRQDISKDDVYAYSDMLVKYASLVLDKPEEELGMFKDMSSQVMYLNLKLNDDVFKHDLITVEQDSSFSELNLKAFEDYYEDNKEKVDIALAYNRFLSRIDYLNYKVELSDIHKYFDIEWRKLRDLGEDATDEELVAMYEEIDSVILNKFKYTKPYDVSRANHTEAFEKWKSDKSYQPTREEWSQMSTYEKDQIEAWEIEKYWTQYPEKGISTQEIKDLIKKERPWMFKN